MKNTSETNNFSIVYTEYILKKASNAQHQIVFGSYFGGMVLQLQNELTIYMKTANKEGCQGQKTSYIVEILRGFLCAWHLYSLLRKPLTSGHFHPSADFWIYL